MKKLILSITILFSALLLFTTVSYAQIEPVDDNIFIIQYTTEYSQVNQYFYLREFNEYYISTESYSNLYSFFNDEYGSSDLNSTYMFTNPDYLVRGINYDDNREVLITPSYFKFENLAPLSDIYFMVAYDQFGEFIPGANEQPIKFEIIQGSSYFFTLETREMGSNAYTQGYQDGWRDGGRLKDSYYERGVIDGYDNGYSIGYNEGLNASNPDAYNKGFIDGSKEGFEANIHVWIVPAILVVIVLGGIVSFMFTRRGE